MASTSPRSSALSRISAAISSTEDPPSRQQFSIWTRRNPSNTAAASVVRSALPPSASGHSIRSNGGCVAVHKTAVTRQKLCRKFIAALKRCVQRTGSVWISSKMRMLSSSACSRRIELPSPAKSALRNCTCVVKITGTSQRSVKRCRQSMLSLSSPAISSGSTLE